MSERGMLKSMLMPHACAEALIDARIDALRDGGELSSEDGAWLDAHLDGCMRCREHESSRRELEATMHALRGVRAPQGFAGRVMMAARARGRDAPAAAEPRSWVPFSQLATGAALVVLVAGGITVLVAIGGNKTSPHGEGLQAAGGAALNLGDSPHFTVRAPGIGAAKARSQVTAIVRAHGGSFEDVNGALIAKIPRRELLGVTQDLASQGRYKMSKSDAGELEPALETIIIRFELE